MRMGGRDWTDDYYDALWHYAWAPDDLDHLSDPQRARKGRPSPNDTIKRLRRLEVPFNHLLGFFFSLAPTPFVVDLFQPLVVAEACGDLVFLGRDFERRLRIDGITQPDFVFTSDRAFLTIELKIESKSSIEQLQKYAFLHSFVEQSNPGRTHALLFLTPHQESSLFPGKVGSLLAARNQAAKYLREGVQQKWSMQKVAISRAAELLEDMDALKIRHCSFSDFAKQVCRFRDMAAPRSVETKLYDGLLQEIARRQLAPVVV